MDKLNLIGLIKKYISSGSEEYGMSAYALKGLFEYLTKDYISVEDFQQAMIQAGFTPLKHPDYNHHYTIIVKESPEIPSRFWGIGYNLLKAD